MVIHYLIVQDIQQDIMNYYSLITIKINFKTMEKKSVRGYQG